MSLPTLKGAQGPGYQHTGLSQPFSPSRPRGAESPHHEVRPGGRNTDPGGQWPKCSWASVPPLEPSCTDPRSPPRLGEAFRSSVCAWR